MEMASSTPRGRLRTTPRAQHMLGFRIGGESVGVVGLLVLGATALAAGVLAVVGAHSKGLAGISTAIGARAPTASSGSASPTRASPAMRPPGGASGANGGAAASTTTTAPASSTSTTSTTLGPTLASTPYAPYAYQVYPGAESAATRQVMAGFDVSVKPKGASIDVTISVVGSSQPPIASSYPSVDHVYFIEANLGDESGNQDFNLGDDGIVVTNAHDRIVG